MSSTNIHTNANLLRLSATLAAPRPSPTLYINERVKALWAAGKPVYHLGFGESRFPVHPKLQTALAENAHQKSYLAAQGLAALREAMAAYYTRWLGIEATAEQIIVGPGSKSLIFALQMALDAELILPTPSWVSYAPQARLLGRPIHTIPATPPTYTFSLEALAATVAQSSHPTKILIINSPNNPTGEMLEEEFLRELANFCREQRIVVLSDEIYGRIEHGPVKHRSIAEFYPEGSVVLGGLSKHLSLGGWRLGAAVLPPTAEGQQLMRAILTVASEIWSTPTAPVQVAAVLAYSGDAELEAYTAECARIHAARTQHVWSWLNELGIPCEQPTGAFYMFPNFDRWREPLAARGVHTSEDLAAHLLDHYQIAALPGTAFGTPPQDLSLRLATSYLDMETDAQAEAVLAAARAGATAAELLERHHPATNEALGRFQAFVASLTQS